MSDVGTTIQHASTGRSMRACRGFALVEVLVSLAIGLFLIGGALYTLVTSRDAYRTNEIVARLQEQARYALASIEPDIELAGFYGFTNTATGIELQRPGALGAPAIPAARLRQSSDAGESPPVPAPLPATAQACGRNFAVDLLMPVQGSNNTFVAGPDATSSCTPYAPGARAGADTLTIRRVEVQTTTADAGRLQLYASRIPIDGPQRLFLDGTRPGPVDTHHEIHDLLVRTFYVARRSVSSADLPALRTKTLTAIAGSAAFLDTELMAGVEDLQIQLGIDTSDSDDDGSSDAPSTSRVLRYVDPDSPLIARSPVVAVRVWLRVRSEAAEPNFVDSRTYRYADIEFTPAGAERHFRRYVASRTIAVRNSRKT